MQHKRIIIRPKLLYYIKNMLIAICTNIYILINFVNEARYQALNIILNKNVMFNFW